MQGEFVGGRDGGMFVQDDNLLIIAKVGRDHAGPYTCGGKNHLGATESNPINLEVLGKHFKVTNPVLLNSWTRYQLSC